jgi:hypothetical protein
MATLTQASHQWATRPDDQRHLSLHDMLAQMERFRDQSHATVTSTRRIMAVPTEDNRGIEVIMPDQVSYAPTHWSFGQLAGLAEAPAGYLRTLPAPIAADCVNYGLKFKRDIEDVGALLYQNGENISQAFTGPRYGRIWNDDIVRSIIKWAGDGVTGQFKVPGEFGVNVPITKQNTTLYSSDRDMFVFLADEGHMIDVPDRRYGKSGTMSRGVFIKNSQVGATTLSVATFLFDYVCKNRIVWGATDFKEVSIRHTASAPNKWLEEVQPVIESYANGAASNVVKAIELSREKRVDDVDSFLKERFGSRLVGGLKAIHQAEEDRPIETLWDVTTAATAYARSIQHQDTRVELEKKAGDVMSLAS